MASCCWCRHYGVEKLKQKIAFSRSSFAFDLFGLCYPPAYVRCKLTDERNMSIALLCNTSVQICQNTHRTQAATSIGNILRSTTVCPACVLFLVCCTDYPIKWYTNCFSLCMCTRFSIFLDNINFEGTDSRLCPMVALCVD